VNLVEAVEGGEEDADDDLDEYLHTLTNSRPVSSFPFSFLLLISSRSFLLLEVILFLIL